MNSPSRPKVSGTMDHPLLAAHPAAGVPVENFELGGRQMLNADDLYLVMRNAQDITFSPVPPPVQENIPATLHRS